MGSESQCFHSFLQKGGQVGHVHTSQDLGHNLTPLLGIVQPDVNQPRGVTLVGCRIVTSHLLEIFKCI